MVRLYCVIVGVASSPFRVAIGLDQSVRNLKESIHEKMKYRFSAVKLQLFMAKKKDGQWLNADEAAAVQEVSKSFNLMIATRRLNYAKNLGDNFQSGEGQVYVLVVVPEYAAWYGNRGSKV